MKKQKGYVIINIIIAIVCIITLSVPIIQALDIINYDKEKYMEKRKLINLMRDLQDYVNSSEEVLSQSKNIDGYTVDIKVEDVLSKGLYRYQISIKKDDILESLFYMIKMY